MVDIWVIYGYYMVNDTDNHFLVGDIPTPLKNMKVNGIFLPSIWKNMFQTTSQFNCYGYYGKTWVQTLVQTG